MKHILDVDNGLALSIFPPLYGEILMDFYGSEGELIGWDSSRRPSVRPCVGVFPLSNMHISETG